MVSKITSFVVSVATVIMALTGWLVSVEAPEDKSDFTPVIRFVACSDSHFKTAADKANYRLEKTLKLAYAIADEDSEYNKLDAFVINGDITNDGTVGQFSGFKSVIDRYLSNETELLPIIANNHDFRNMGKGTVAYFSELMNKETDYHKVVNGYHFIGISTSDVEGVNYTEDQRVWLKAQLDEAVADDPDKPIFVSHHEHVSNTVFGSSDFDGWGMDFFTDILEQYPQIVDFSGHSHYPVNDPRSIWQGSFTAVGTGSLSYLEFTVDDTRKYHPDGYSNEAQFWIVELDKDSNMRLRGIDLIEEKVLCEYILANPANPQNREYTPEKQAERSSAPIFGNDAKLTVSRFAKNVTVKFDAAQSASNDPVFLYRVEVVNSNGETVKSEWIMPEYYSATVETGERLRLGKLDKGDYTVYVTAENAWGVQSEPLTAEFSV